MVERLSIELSRRCSKACAFCYSHSTPAGDVGWQVDDVLAFVLDCAKNGVRAVSFGGGEPLEYEGLFDVLTSLDGILFRSFTTNGLHLEAHLDDVVAARPDKVHVSVHFPDREREVVRVISDVQLLAARGIAAGVNLLVDARKLPAATWAHEQLTEAGIGPDRIVLLPLRGAHTPSAAALAAVAGGKHFQSMTCLLACARSPRFASLDSGHSAAFCSYTTARRPLPTLDHAGLMAALDGLGLTFCGGAAGSSANPAGLG